MKKIRSTVLCLAIASVVPALGQATSSDHFTFDIEEQSLRSAIYMFASQARMQVLYKDEDISTRGGSAPALSGVFSAEQALSRILAGSGFTYEFVNDRTVRIAPLALVGQGSGNSQSSSSNRGAAEGGAATAAKGQGDEREGQLEEVVVTAQKREQRLIDVPISITAITSKQLDSARIDSIQDLAFTVPGMSAAEIGPGRQLITLRGMGGTRGNSSLTGVYLDEMSVSGLQDGFIATYIDLDTTDLERVEVLKGPQGTLFGEGSVGGTLRFITRDPDLSSISGNLAASLFGNEKSNGLSKQVRGVLNMPVVEDKFGLRVAATYNNEAGWIDRLQTVNGPVIQRDFNNSELKEARIKALWKPLEDLSVKGMVVIHRDDGGGSNVVNLQPRDRSQFIIEFEPTAPTGFKDDYDLYNLTATYDWSVVQLLSSTSYSDTYSAASLMQRKPLIPSPDPGFQELLVRDYTLDASAFSQELRLSSRVEGPLHWTAGLSYKNSRLAHQDIGGFDFVRFGGQNGQLDLHGLDGDLRPTFKSKSWAAFGDASYALTSRVEVGTGLRYFKDKRKTFDGSNIAATFVSGTFDDVTYRTFVSYALTTNAKIYGSVATGFRSGGFNDPSAVADGARSLIDPEKTTSYELGAKMEVPASRFSAQAAAFYSTYSDIQMNSNFINSNNVPVGYTGNFGKAEIKGVELELNWGITERLLLRLCGDVLRTEITEAASDQTAFVVGDPIDLVPRYHLAFAGDYNVHWNDSMPGYLRLQYNEQGRTTSTLRSFNALEPITYTPILNFLSASVGARWNEWNFELFGQNLIDEIGALRTGGGIDPQARPRTYGVRFDKSF